MKKVLFVLFSVLIIAGLVCCDGNVSKKGGYTPYEPVVDDSILVTFNTNGGSEIAPIKVSEGGTVTTPTNPALANHIFCGWTTDSNACSTSTNFDFGTVLTENTTLYAKWVSTIYYYPLYSDGFAQYGITSWTSEYCPSPTIVKSSNNAITWNAGYYIVIGDVTIKKPVTCSGNVSLILADGCHLTVNTEVSDSAGINVTGNNWFTVCAQSTDTDIMGKLTVNAGLSSAAIGGNNGQDGKNIRIHGGYITTIQNSNGAGIGGGNNATGTNIVINGGLINACGGTAAAGIGGGKYGNGNELTINGGIVIAEGGATGSDIGAGIGGGYKGTASKIYINGGSICATGGVHDEFTNIYGDGIGKGYQGSTATNIYVNPYLVAQVADSGPGEPMFDNIPAHDINEDIASFISNKRYCKIYESDT